MKPVRIDFEQPFCGLRLSLLSLLSLECVSFFLYTLELVQTCSETVLHIHINKKKWVIHITL